MHEITWQQVVVIALGFANGLLASWLTIVARRVDRAVSTAAEQGSEQPGQHLRPTE